MSLKHSNYAIMTIISDIKSVLTALIQIFDILYIFILINTIISNNKQLVKLELGNR